MTQIRLGKTEIVTNKNGFGDLPIQRISFEDADALIMHAYENGITFFDTARFYTDSEQKLGKASAPAVSETKCTSPAKPCVQIRNSFGLSWKPL